jgi:putative transposase
VDAIGYGLRGGIQWRMMPKDFPPWKTVYDHFSKWNKRGIREKCLDRLTASHRLKEGRIALPSYGIIDAQSVKTRYASEKRGIDGGKKVPDYP